MRTNSSIYLTSLDVTNQNIDTASREIANYFKDTKTHIILSDFCELLKRSGKWKFDETETKLNEAKEDLEQTYKNDDIKIHKLLTIIEKAFKYAINHSQEFLGQLRGRLFEGVLVGLYGGTYILEHPPRNEQRGWGVGISLNSTLKEDIIAFEDPAGDFKKNRKTMDYVYIKGGKRLFYECKIQPDRFGESESEYFKIVHSRMKEQNEDHCLCFFAADIFEEIEMEFADEELSHPLFFIGYDNAFEFINKHK